jgi:hypothetical protein
LSYRLTASNRFAPISSDLPAGVCWPNRCALERSTIGSSCWSAQPLAREHGSAKRAAVRLAPGTRLIRQWREQRHEVTVLERGFVYRGHQQWCLQNTKPQDHPGACQGTGRVAPAGWVTLHGLMEELPWDWNEQRRRFRLAARKNDSLGVRD